MANPDEAVDHEVHGRWLPHVPWIDSPDADLENFLKRYALGFPGLEALLRQWRKQGYVILKNAISRGLVDSFVEELSALRDDPHKFLISIELNGQQTWSRAVSRDAIAHPSVKFNHLHTASLHAANLCLAEPIMAFLKAIFLAPPAAMQSLAFWKGSQQRTHIDYPYVKRQLRLPRMAASWIALEDVRSDSGPLGYFPGAHKPEVSGFFDWGGGLITAEARPDRRTASDFADYLENRLSNNGYTAEIFLPEKGDAIIWHANLPHFGSRIVDPDLTRKSLVTHYTGLFDYPKEWLQGEKSTAQSFLHSHGGFAIEYPWNVGREGVNLPSWKFKAESSSKDLYSLLAIPEAEYSKRLFYA